MRNAARPSAPVGLTGSSFWMARPKARAWSVYAAAKRGMDGGVASQRIPPSRPSADPPTIGRPPMKTLPSVPWTSVRTSSPI